MGFSCLYITCTFECIQTVAPTVVAAMIVLLHIFQVHQPSICTFLLLIHPFCCCFSLASSQVTSHILQYYSYFSLFLGFQLVGSRDKKKCRQKENCDVYIIYIYAWHYDSIAMAHSINEDDGKTSCICTKKRQNVRGFFSRRQSARLSKLYILFKGKIHNLKHWDVLLSWIFVLWLSALFLLFSEFFFFILPSSSLFWLLESLEFTCFRMLAR